ncbi:MAG TPA: PQQ-dependent sugar dehydrogenase [Nitrospira sp.]|nr:PQQ-dependent sugar dehydrogenase [Nitrospira sp.]
MWWAPRRLAYSYFGLFALLLVACNGSNGGVGGGTGPAPGPSNSLTLQPVATSTVFSSPLFLAAPSGTALTGNTSETRLFIVEQAGLIRIVDSVSGALIGTFLDVTSRVLSGGERGLLGMAFDPDYTTNGFFYIYYTARATGAIADGDIVIARYQANPPTANVAGSTETVLKTISHSTNANHNGGMLAFGPDGCLYAGVGDGGGAGDVPNNAQTKTVLLGKILRLNPLTGNPCAFVISNPFVLPGGAPEVWSFGLRNPYRFSFDRTAGNLYIGDVGESLREEIDVAQAPNAGREINYGWHIMEGFLCFNPPSGCNTAGLTLPILDYTHDDGACSIIGGYVYRGTKNAAVTGTYFYGDHCAGFVRSFQLQNGALGTQNTWPLLSPPAGQQITSFGEDAQGELYLVTQPGGLFRIVAN